MTLIEVVLAITLSCGLVGAALAFYRQAVDVRSRLEARVRVTESQRLIMEHVTNELRAAINYPFLNIGMEGTDQTVSFIVAGLPGPSAWAIRKSNEDPIRPETDLALVGYRVGAADDENGQQVTTGLERTVQRILTATTAEEGKDIDVAVLGDGIQFLGLRYWAQGAWAESWSGGDMPQAVEVTLGEQPLPEGTKAVDYPFPAFRRVIYLPTVAPAPQQGGTVIRRPRS